MWIVIPLILISFIFGFLPLWLIIVITVPVAVVAACCWYILITRGRELELGFVLPFVPAVCGTIGLLIMWVTHLTIVLLATHVSISFY